MSDTFFSFWRKALDRDLAVFRSGAIVSEQDSGKWMAGWAAGGLILLLSFYFGGGYHAGFAAINSLGSDLPSWVWQCVTSLADERVVIALMLPIARRRPDVFWAFVLTIIIALLMSYSLKHLANIARPPAILVDGSFNLIGPGHERRSFPSGHSIAISAFMGVWVWFVRDWRLRFALILFAYEIAVSRVAVGVHWPVDVLAGALVGCLAAWLGSWLGGKWRRFGLSLIPHLIGLLLCLFHAFFLLFDDGGYHQAGLFQQGIVLFALSAVFFEYLLNPCRSFMARRPGKQKSKRA